MATDPPDLYGAIARSAGRSAPPRHVGVGTVLGHVHLCVADAAVAEAFYRDVIGLDVMVRLRSNLVSGVGQPVSEGNTPAPGGFAGSACAFIRAVPSRRIRVK